jgi:hypothetical protein
MSAETAGASLTVRLDVSDADPEEAAAVAGQIPPASTLSPRTRVTVPGTATRQGGVLRRLLGQRSVPVSRAVRCTALLVRGYVDIGADDEGAWGYAPAR